MTDAEKKAREIVDRVRSALTYPVDRTLELGIASALAAERDKALRECRGIIGRHKRYWEDADAEISDLQKRRQP